MLAKIPNIIKKTFTYGIFNSISAAVPFFLLPILTRYLTPEGYGIIAIINVIILFLGAIFRLELQGALKREYVEKKEDFPAYVGTSLIIPVVIFGISLVIFIISYPFLETTWDIPPLWFLGILIITFGAALGTYLAALYQIMDKALCSGLWEMLTSTAVFAGTFILVLFFGFDWQGRIWPIVGTSIFIQIPLSFYLIYRIVPYRLVFDLKKTLEMLKYSAPLIPMTLVGYVLLSADRVFITEMIGLEAAGIYAVSAQLAAIMMIAYNSFLPTWEALVLQKLKENTRNGYKYIILIFCLYVFATIALTLFVILVFPHIMPYVLGKSFMGSMNYLSWLVSGVALRGVFYALAPFIYYIRKTQILLYTNIFLVILYCILSYVLILMNGVIGAAQATFLVYAVGFSIFLYIIWKYIKIPAK